MQFHKAVQKLGYLYFQQKKYQKSLIIFRAIKRLLPKNKEAIIGVWKSLIALGRLEEAKHLHDSQRHNFDFNTFGTETWSALLNVALDVNCITSLSRSDFSDQFFVEYLAAHQPNFLKKISRRIFTKYESQFLALAQSFSSKHGARLLYLELYDLRHVKNKNANERALAALTGRWESLGFASRIEWLQSSPYVVEMYKELPDFSTDYIKGIFQGAGNVISGTKIISRDYASDFVNVENNVRRTTDSPATHSNTINIFGASETFGFGSEDNKTFASYLQRKLPDSKHYSKYRVLNNGVMGNPLAISISNLLQTDIRPGDVCIIVGPPIERSDPALTKSLEVIQCNFSRPHDYGDIFIDRGHLGWKGNKVIADNIYDGLCLPSRILPNAEKPKANSDETASSALELIRYFIFREQSERHEKHGLNEYIKYLREYKYTDGTVGSVLVNCNPMTLGHLHLFEYAARYVDHLLIFVVEDDSSYFSFKDRMLLVKKGTKHLSNATVLRAGRYICTEFTYPDYFSKDKTRNIYADASLDAWFFCEHIAKELNISIVFQGEEPSCQFTQQYNKQWEDKLSEHGIVVNTIPRMLCGAKIISASKVRDSLQNQDLDSVKDMVPVSTYEFLVDKAQSL